MTFPLFFKEKLEPHIPKTNDITKIKGRVQAPQPPMQYTMER